MSNPRVTVVVSTETSSVNTPPVTSQTADAADPESTSINAPPVSNSPGQTSAAPLAKVYIKRIADHILSHDDSSVKLTIEWERGDPSNEPEWVIQEDAPETLYAYWEDQGGRCEATKFDKYVVFKLLDHTTRKGKRWYQVQWTGYSPNDSTWERGVKIKRIALADKKQYDAAKGLR
ncbi:hypothetical protein ACHAPU_009136 [Fusarium lateritium]